ncbi:LCP family protein [Cohnella luojiensis]|uniref:LytR family transcriptional regulator n=1 Tax=Cohnella luojiensis TaxID=652876 RepID=A0A4Y8LNN8_9BACL|nr:LCP family protein [Cohnella luojiensis]TFE22624.1 LytR family transcriptional regulator [Cohnella luojiensis]
MKRALVIKIAIYSMLSLIMVGLLGGGYLWYSMEKTMGKMYEPLPSKEWAVPVFESESLPGTLPIESPVLSDANAPEVTDATTIQASVSADGQGESISGYAIDREEVERLLHPDLSEEDPFSILLLGVDERQGDRGRSDTMILLTLQPKKGSALALSIPRDTRALMPNSGKYDKINHAYAFGGTSLAVEAVEHLFGVPIAFYMKTNMEGMVNIVDTVGGVDINNPRAFDFDGFSFPLGIQHLNGNEALAYSRMRKEDPHGDFGRTQRQRQLLSNAIDRVVSVNSITKLPRLLSQLSDYVRTNLTSSNMIDLAVNYRPTINNIETLYLNGSGKMINGIYYYTVTPEDRQKIQTIMLNHLSAA